MASDSVAVTPLWSDSRFHSRDIPVVSFAHNATNHYLDYYNSSFSNQHQMSVLRASFKASAGRRLLLSSYDFDSAEIVHEGSWCRILSHRERAATEFTTGICTLLPYNVGASGPEPDNFSRAARFEGGVALVAASGYNVHHFVWEHLPSIFLNRDLVESRGRLLVGQSDQGSNAFAQRFLDLLGIRARVEPLDLRTRIPIFNTTVLGAFPFRVYPIDTMNEIVAEIRSSPLLPPRNHAIAPYGVIYLGRGDSERNRRVLVNEVAVINELRQVWPRMKVIRSGLTRLDNTIHALRDAKVVIGPTAGALVHHLWANELSHLIELVPDEYPGITESQELESMLNFQHHAVPTARESRIEDISWVNSDQTCDLEALRAVAESVRATEVQ